jgi:MFS family permease
MFERLQSAWREFPPKFWVVVGASFIDRIGGTLIFPFFALYITGKFGVGMTQAGVLIGLFSAAGLAGSMVGGALTDRFGRRVMVLFGLVFSALSSVAMGLVNDLAVFYPLAFFVGLLSDIAGPAWQAMIADVLPEDQRAEGFGVMRVAGNMAWIVGPTIGGLMAARSFLMLFLMDATTSLITASIIYRLIPETQAPGEEGAAPASILTTFAGYRQVLADRLFMAYILVSIPMLIVYFQLYNTLSVYLRDEHGVSPQGYGFLLTTSAITVILLQFWVTRRVKNRPPMLMMAFGAAFYLVGFTMFGLVSAYAFFAAAVVLITAGEMIIMPVGQALAANFSPVDMRGRYMAVFSLAWALPATFGPGLAGVVLDRFDPNWVWYGSGVLCAVAVAGFIGLHPGARARFAPPPSPSPALPQ